MVKVVALRSMEKAQLPIKGFSIIEALLAGALFAILAGVFTSAVLEGTEGAVVAGARARSLLLADEGLEAVRNIRDSSFSLLTVGTHGMAVSGNQWIFSGSSDVTDIFTRRVSVATVDSDRKQVTSTVTWQQTPQRTGSVSLVTYLTNWLASAGQSGKCVNPYERATTDMSGAENGLKIQVQGSYAYIVCNDGTPDFAIFDITNPNAPSMVGSLNLSGIPTNIFVDGSYAYVSSQDDNEELQIISAAIPSSPSVVGTFNAAGTQNANGVFVAGSTAYIVRTTGTSDEFVVVNTATPTAPTLVGSLDLGATGYELSVVGTTAAIASGHNSQELQVISLATPSAPTLSGSYNLNGNTDASTIIASGNYAYMGRGNVFYVFNISPPASPSLSGSLNVTGSVFDLAQTIGGGSAVYVGTDTTSGEFKVIDISTPSTPTLLCSLDVTGNNPLLGIAYDEGTDTVFAAGSSDTGELVIIAPQ